MQLDYCLAEFDIEVDLPSSKSIHNRALVLNTLYELGLEIKYPSESEDSLLMNKLLKSNSNTLDCENAGTVFRFLTAYLCIGNKAVELTGSDRMLKRPIADLVEALRSLGAEIEYMGQNGYPPLLIKGGLKTGGHVKVNGNLSSQFISALILIGPKLHGGLQIELEGNISSRPYIEMTIKLMNSLGFNTVFSGNKISCETKDINLVNNQFEIEPDWSAVAFWIQIIAFSIKGKVFIKRLVKDSIQGDSIIMNWAGSLGVKASFQKGGMVLEKSDLPILNNTEWNFVNYPDLAPSIIVLLATFKRKAFFRGLESLQIKESDRTAALAKELKKCKVEFYPFQNGWQLDAGNFELLPNTVFETYNDHRIAMALATLSFIKPLVIKNPEVVAKSYPGFWKDLELVKKNI
jgi:3-phosphoshikimate 1-carboxyvinyltransferase